MAQLSITLVNNSSDTLTRYRTTERERSVPLAHELCRAVERETNEHPAYSAFGPWKIVSYGWGD